MNEQSRALIAGAAARAAHRPFYLASALAAFQELRSKGDAELAEFLGSSPEALDRLRLCRRPDVDSSQFQSDVRQIIQTFSLHPTPLLQLLREVTSVETMRRSEPAASTGFLIAARDKPRRRRRVDEKRRD